MSLPAGACPPEDQSPADPFILTASGVGFTLVNPKPENVRLRDIARGLANANRFNGQTSRPWSVAAHSLLMVEMAPEPLKPLALIHDAAEAYTGDVTRPLKAVLGYAFARIEGPILHAIFRRLGLSATESDWEEIARLDLQLLAVEAKWLMHPIGEEKQWRSLKAVRDAGGYPPELDFALPHIGSHSLYDRDEVEWRWSATAREYFCKDSEVAW